MDDYITRTLSAYDSNPEKYEDATKDMTPMEELKAFIQVLPNKELPVLDAGCAFGRDTVLFAEQGLKTLGVDMSDGLLKRAKVLYPNLSFQKMDVRNLKLGDNSIAGIWCHATLLHLKNEDIAKALQEFIRVLIPKGVVFISLKEGTGEEEFVEKFSSESARFYKFQTVESISDLINESGLTITKIYTINERQRWGNDKRDLNWVYCFARK